MRSWPGFSKGLFHALMLCAVCSILGLYYITLPENSKLSILPDFNRTAFPDIEDLMFGIFSKNNMPVMPPISKIKKFENVKSDFQLFREQHLDIVIKAIHDNYLANESVSTTKFVVAQCGFPRGLPCYDRYFMPLTDGWFREGSCRYSTAQCKGFGDRIRGLITAFYLAIGMHRQFIVSWPGPSDTQNYFDLNDDFHPANRSSSSIEKQEHWIFNLDYSNEALFSAPFADKEFSDKYGGKDYIGVMANRHAGLDDLLDNAAFQTHLRPILSTLPDGDVKFRNQVLIAAALRIVFGKPKNKLLNLINSIIERTVGREKWDTSLKIGVQIRSGVIKNFEADSRVKVPLQVPCFGSEVQDLLFHRFPRDTPIVIFLTADISNEDAITLIKKGSSSLVNASIFSSEMAFPNLTVTHIDSNIQSGDSEEVWFRTSKTFVDWVLLTWTDYLFITRSGFGEAAAKYSMVPTRRFEHWNDTHCIFHDYFGKDSFKGLKSTDFNFAQHWLNIYEVL